MSFIPCRMPKSDAVPSSGAVEDSGASSSCISQQHGTPLLHRSTPLELWRIVVFTVTDAVPSSGAVEVCCVHSRCNSSIEHRYLHSPKNIQHPTQCPALELWRIAVISAAALQAASKTATSDYSAPDISIECMSADLYINSY